MFFGLIARIVSTLVWRFMSLSGEVQNRVELGRGQNHRKVMSGSPMLILVRSGGVDSSKRIAVKFVLAVVFKAGC